MSAWKKAGWSFVRANSVAASMVRRSLKPEVRAEAVKRDSPILTLQYFQEGTGKVAKPYQKRVDVFQ